MLLLPLELSAGGLPTWWIYPALDSEAIKLVQREAGCITNGLAAPMSLWKIVNLGLGVSLVRSILGISFPCRKLILD